MSVKLQINNTDILLKILKSVYLKSNDIIINRFIVDKNIIIYGKNLNKEKIEMLL